MNGDSQQQPVPPQPDGNWQYHPEVTPVSTTPAMPTSPAAPPLAAAPQQASWTASEYITHEKGLGWYGIMGLGAAIIAGLVYLITRDIFSVGIIVVVALLFGVSAGRKPRVLTYHLDNQGLTIGQKLYPYSDFKSFSVVQEGAFSSITFLPLKRFMPGLTVYYDPKDEESIAAVLSQHLPFEQREADLIDKAIRHMRF